MSDPWSRQLNGTVAVELDNGSDTAQRSSDRPRDHVVDAGWSRASRSRSIAIDAPVSGDDLVRRDRACVWHPYTQHGIEQDPLPVIRAKTKRCLKPLKQWAWSFVRSWD